MADNLISSTLIIRVLSYDDCERISSAFSLQGWKKPVEQYKKYLQEMTAGNRDVFIAEVGGEFAGYITILWRSDYPPFYEAGIPEIADFNVLIKFRRQGIGTSLMDAAERIIVERSPLAGIGVGLMPDYGAAQVLYVKRGYIPDGRGVVSHGEFIKYGDTVIVDDDIALYLTKSL